MSEFITVDYSKGSIVLNFSYESMTYCWRHENCFDYACLYELKIFLCFIKFHFWSLAKNDKCDRHNVELFIFA